MGSLEDESEGPVKDCQHRDGDTDDREHLGGADVLRAGPEPSPTNTGQRSASQEDHRPEVQKVNIQEEELESSEAAVDPAVAVDGVTVVLPAEPLAVMTPIAANSCPPTESVPLESEQPSTDDPSTENKVVASSTRSATLSSCGPTDSETRNQKPNTQEERAMAEALSVDNTTGKEKPEQGGGEAGGGEGGGGVEVPPVPPSPAPPGQQHMRTQVSLEVVQCHSVACSPMTPPEGGHTFVFPEGVQSNDGKVQMAHQVEFRSIATAPMTPRTPTASTFSDVVKGELGQVEGEVRMGDGGPEKGPAQLASSQVTAQSTGRPQTHRIPSLDQDITILVTQHDSTTESLDDEDEKVAKASVSAVAGPIAKIEEDEDHKADREAVDTGEEVRKERVESQVSTANSHTQKKSLTEHAPNKPISNLQQSKMQIEGPSIIFRDKDHPVQKKTSKSTIGETKEDANLGDNLPEGVTKGAGSLKMPAVPSSPAPSGCSNMYTQVSLEVVQCQSAATSPMTPPEGGNTFIFPTSGGRSTATTPQVEYRSIATAPMTPRTPLAPIGFPASATAEPEVQKMPEVDTDKGKGNARKTVADVHEEGGSSMGNGRVEIGKVEGTKGEEGKVEATSGKEGKVEGTTREEGKVEATSGEEGKVEGTTREEGKVEATSGEEGKVEGKSGDKEKVDGMTGEEGKVEVKSGEEGKVEKRSGEEGKVDGTMGEGKASGSTGNKGKVEVILEREGKVGETTGEAKVDGTTVREAKVDGSTGRDGKVDGSTGREAEAEGTTEREAKGDGTTVREGKVDGTTVTEAKVDGSTGREGKVDGSTGREGKVDGSTEREAEAEGTTEREAKVDGSTGREGKVDGSTGREGKVDGTTVREAKLDGSSGKEGKVDGTTVREAKLDGSTGREGKVGGTTAGEERAENNCKEGGEEESEEPVQEVSWDDKGMTWEVYGAVVEVAVLGSAIQKHLEKQVKKQKQPSLPPPPPLDPSAVPLPCTLTGTTTTTSTTTTSINSTTDPTQVSSAKGRAGKRGERGMKEGRRRRNPFRLLLRNMQQPRCCSRAHSAE